MSPVCVPGVLGVLSTFRVSLWLTDVCRGVRRGICEALVLQSIHSRRHYLICTRPQACTAAPCVLTRPLEDVLRVAALDSASSKQHTYVRSDSGCDPAWRVLEAAACSFGSLCNAVM
jgi:hypothetical protein